MNILVVGSGGREHTFAWKLKQSPLCDQLFIAPGNAGTASCGTNLNIKPTDFEALKNAALDYNIEMIVVGPEDPLVIGIYDYFANQIETKHIQVIGPSAQAAQLEGSKGYAKAFMNKYYIPTAAYAAFDYTSFEEGVQYIKKHSLPIVLKADGLAAGKGVLICHSQEEALKEFELMIKQSKFGEASNKVVIEQFLTGIEVSVFVLTNGKEYIILPEAKDYKRIGEGDTGLNTGGMGAISPVPFFNKALKNKIISKIIEPTINGLQSEQLIYEGFVFIGLMIDNNEPYVIEYNCRMGDPETEVVIPRIKNDLVEIFQAIKKNTLHTIEIVTDTRTATTTVAVSGGYPEQYTTGELIEGLSDLPNKDCIIFHSGTAKSNENIITNGGRVLAVTAFGENIPMAKERSSQLLSTIHFNNMYFRSDIGFEFI